MALIDNEEAARRLARVILSDIEIYQQKRIDAGDDMSGDLAEGRALFGRRVTPQLAPIFDAVLSTRRLGGRSANLPDPPLVIRPVVAIAAPPASPAPLVSPPPPEPSPAAAAPVSATEDAVGAEMSLAETGRSVVTAEIAQSMMVQDSAPEHDTTSPDEPPAVVLAAAALAQPKVPTDDRATPVPVEDIVSRPPARDDLPPPPPVEAAPEKLPEPAPDEPAPPQPPESATDEERVTAPGMAVFTEPEPEPIKLSPPMPPAVATPPAPMPTPPPIPAAARAGTPRPIVVAQRPPEGTGEAPAKTPQPLSLPTASPGLSSPGMRIGTPGGSPRVATPFRSGAFQPLNLPPMTELAVAAPLVAAPAESPAARADDVVNLRKKTSKVVVLLVIVAVIGGVMLIGRFLTRFL